MPTYIALLRAINLGATRKFPQASIIEATQAAGGTEVETYINTGNVRVRLPQRSRARAEELLERAYRADRGFEVVTITLTPAELSEIAADAAGLAADRSVAMQYVSVLKQAPPAATAREVEERAAEYGEGLLAVRGRGVHLLLDHHDGYRTSRLGNTWIERTLGPATNRNRNVIATLAQRWGGG